MGTPRRPARRRFPHHVRRAGVIVAAVLAALVLFLWLFDWSILGGPVAALASRALHRKVQIGHFSAHLLRWAPTVTIRDLRVANPSWADGPYMAQIGSVTVGIEPWQLLRGRLVLSQLQIDDPKLDLQRDAQRRANWDFNAAAENPQPPKPATAPHLPAVNLFTMQGGSLTLRDDIRKLRFEGRVIATERNARSRPEPLRIQGHGELNGEPFKLSFDGSALFNLRLDQPYRFAATISAGSLSAAARGEIDRPFNFAHFGAALDLKGQNLAGLYYLTGLALPFTPPFHVAGNLRNDSQRFTFDHIEATVGSSDLHGKILVDAARARSLITAELTSRALDLGDLAPSVGAGVPNTANQADLSAPSPKRTTHGLLPTYHFDFDRLRKTDAQVQLHADSVKTKIPIKALQLGVRLDHGQLSLDPLKLTLPEGVMSGVVHIDARGSSAVAAMDLRLRNVDLAQFKSAQASTPPLEGTLLSRVQLKGSGNSVHDIFADSSGMFTAVIPHGAVRKAFAELTGINVARGLGLLVTGNQKQTPIRCAIAAFGVNNGVARVRELIFSTGAVRVTGSGDIDFINEGLNLQLRGQSKKFALFRIRAPIVIGGTFTKPSFGLKPGPLLAQGAVAAALGVLATPAAAVLAFVDPGLAKSADCNALLAQPQANSAEHPGPPRASTAAPAPKRPAPVPRASAQPHH
ncbi:MAG: AsmA family protein [Steroidobacteraceae bacterium]